MKNLNNIIKLLLLVSTCYINAQIKKDTIFLIHNEIQKIYIEPNKESDYYTSLTAFFNSDAKGNKKLKKKSEKWVPLYRYHNDYYLYAPCDFVYHNPIQIKEKKLLVGGAETVLYKIDKTKESLEKHQVKVEYQDYDGKRQYLEYTIIDIQKTIAIFKFQSEYRFMVRAEKVKDYPIIINECIQGKVSEFVFAPSDYKALLRQIK